MSYSTLADNLKAYQDIDASVVLSASPHRIIQMLMAGAMEKIAKAKGHMINGDLAETGSQISWAISIIDGLRMSLDKSVDSEITKNLDDLYEYMNLQLLQANLKKDPKLLDEVTNLLKDIKSGWDGIAKEAEEIHRAQRHEK
jgi:flagellar secretion chaperone FliS